MQKLVFWSAAVCCLTELSFEKVQRYFKNRESWLAYDDFREKTWLDHGTKFIFFLPKRLHSTKSYFIKAIDHTFYGFTSVITHAGCWENTRKACKLLAFGSWFTSFPRVLPTSRVGYHAGKPIERVVYCFYKITFSRMESFR